MVIIGLPVVRHLHKKAPKMGHNLDSNKQKILKHCQALLGLSSMQDSTGGRGFKA